MSLITNIKQLRQKTVPIKNNAEGLKIAKQLLSEIRSLERAGKGVAGLAANQIGINKSVCVIKPPDKPHIVLFNPEIIGWSYWSIPATEQCLSLPGLEYKTIRYETVTVQTNNLRGEELFKGSEAIIVQHEIAHLYGLLAYDFLYPYDGEIDRFSLSLSNPYPVPTEWYKWFPE